MGQIDLESKYQMAPTFFSLPRMIFLKNFRYETIEIHALTFLSHIILDFGWCEMAKNSKAKVGSKKLVGRSLVVFSSTLCWRGGILWARILKLFK